MIRSFLPKTAMLLVFILTRVWTYNEAEADNGCRIDPSGGCGH